MKNVFNWIGCMWGGVVWLILLLLVVASNSGEQSPPVYKINMGYKASYQRYSLTLIATNDSPAYRYITYTHAWMGSVDEINWVYLDSVYISKYRLNDFW